MKLQAIYISNDFSQAVDIIINDEALSSQAALTKFLLEKASDLLPKGMNIKEIHTTIFDAEKLPTWYTGVTKPGEVIEPKEEKKGKK